MFGDVVEAPESKIEWPELPNDRLVDDSEYQHQPTPAPAVDWDYSQLSQIATFAIGALCSSIIWFAILLWLLKF